MANNPKTRVTIYLPTEMIDWYDAHTGEGKTRSHVMYCALDQYRMLRGMVDCLEATLGGMGDPARLKPGRKSLLREWLKQRRLQQLRQAELEEYGNL